MEKERKNILCWPWSKYEKNTFGGADEAFIESLNDHNVFFLYDLLQQGKNITDVILELQELRKEPNYIFVYYPETIEIPHKIYRYPYPLIAFVCESNVRYHVIREYCNIFDFVILDTKELYDSLSAEGFKNIAYINWWGNHPHYHSKMIDFNEKDIDLLFIGNLNSDVQEERGRILFEIASFGFNNAVITTGLYEEEYGMLLNRAKIVFNLNVRCEVNMRCFEAPATGAMLLVDDNPNVRKYYNPGKECITYERNNIDDILAKIQYYLKNDAERIEIAKKGYLRAKNYTYKSIINKIITDILDKQDFTKAVKDRMNNSAINIKYPIITAKSGLTSGRSNILLLMEYKAIEEDVMKRNNIGVHYAMIEKKLEIAEEYLRKAYKSGCKVAGLNLASIIKKPEEIIAIANDILDTEKFLFSFDYELINNGYWFHRKIANITQNNGFGEESLKIIETLLRKKALILKGQALGKLKKNSEGIREIMKAIEIEADFDSCYNLAVLYEKNAKYREAALFYKKCIYYKALDPRLAIKYIKIQKKAECNDELAQFIKKWITATETIKIYSSLKSTFEKHLKDLEANNV